MRRKKDVHNAILANFASALFRDKMSLVHGKYNTYHSVLYFLDVTNLRFEQQRACAWLAPCKIQAVINPLQGRRSLPPLQSSKFAFLLVLPDKNKILTLILHSRTLFDENSSIFVQYIVFFILFQSSTKNLYLLEEVWRKNCLRRLPLRSYLLTIS